MAGLVAVLLVPAVWSTAAATTTQNGAIPAAGPTEGPGGGDLTDDQRRILCYAEQNETAIALAVNGPSMMASSYIIDSDATVIGMGGFMGQPTGQGADHMGQRHEWLEQHCTKVDTSTYGGSSAPPESAGGPMATQTLYDCRS